MEPQEDPRSLVRQAIDQNSDCTIEYVDGNGHWTERSIRPMEDRGALVRARCHLRGEDRSFRYDRMGAVFVHPPREPAEDDVPF